MELQKTFKSNYVSTLKDECKAGITICKYASEAYDIDISQIRSLANVYHPEGLLQKMMDAESDFEAAVALYEAYNNISPLLASNESFWVYLTHTELLPYCQKRWSKVLDEDVSANYILDHWFVSSQGLMRNALASLWWSVYFSVDNNRENCYELTEILFTNYSFRVTWFAVFLRIKNGLLGVLEFIKDNFALFEKNFEMRGRYIAQYINRLGATRQLSYLSQAFFYEECEKIKDDISVINTEADIKDMLGQGASLSVAAYANESPNVEPSVDSKKYFYIHSIGCNAKAKLIGNKIVVLKGSILRKDKTKTFARNARRSQVILEFCTETQEGFLVNEDLPPMTPSGSSGLVQARSSNGKLDWKDENGVSLENYL